jgi:DNA-binding response OmpR family regulator
MNRRILVIEDERDIADLLKLHLSDLCSEVVLAFDGTNGLEQALGGHWDLIILDLRLPGVDGLQICRRVREGSAYTPILMLTSKSSELDRVLGLEMGADDYLTKPFSILELLARVKAIFRRVESMANAGENGSGFIDSGSLFIDADKRTVNINGDAIDLTAKEFDLLVHFARHPGRVYTRTQLLDSVWGYGHEGYEHTVNSHINRLRGKIEQDPASPQMILTAWGVGYKFSDSPASGN